MDMAGLSLNRALMAVEKVRERLLRSTGALERHGIPYAVIGGNAVAVWVARFDEDAVRNTADVNILLRRADLPRASAALNEVGFEFAEVQGTPIFVEKEKPSPRRGIHVVYADERVREHEAHAAPGLSAVARAEDGFAVIDLTSLIKMKLTAFRRKDQLHLADMIELNMIDSSIESRLPADLVERLTQIRNQPE